MKNTDFNYEAFKEPDMSCRGLPFWSWNCKLNEDELSESILAAMASDIKVSVTREKVELVVIKSSQ